MEDLIGKVAICSLGVRGYVTGRKRLPWGDAWIGYAQETGLPWSSRNPQIIDEEPTLKALSAANMEKLNPPKIDGVA